MFRPFRPAHGERFEGEIKVWQARSTHSTIRTRNFMAVLGTVILTVALAGSAALGIGDGHFGKLQDVWNVGSVYAGMLFAKYMGDRPRRKDDDDDDDDDDDENRSDS